MKKNLVVLQDGNNDCGAASLLSVIRYYGGDVSKDRLTEEVKTTKEGTNFYSLSKAISKYGIMTKCFIVDDIEKIKQINKPFIAQINNKMGHHFVVVYKVIDNKIIYMDPSIGKVKTDLFDFASMWTGYIMIFEKVSDIPVYTSDKVLNKVIIKVLINNKGNIIALIVLSILFTLFSSLTSLYSQIVFDKVIDTNLNNLFFITIVFSILYVIKNISSYIRNYLIIYFNQKIDISIIVSTFSKIILLPYHYYKNKTSSEVLSRINDLLSLKNFMSKVIVTCFLDFFTFIVSGIIIYMIDKDILFMMLFISFIYLIIILIFNPIVRKITKTVQVNSALINNNILESVNSFETVKGLNIESNIILKFNKLYSSSLNTLYKSEKISNIILVLRELIFDIGLFMVNYLAIRKIIDNTITNGNYMTIIFLSGYLIYPFRNIIGLLNEYHFVKNGIKRANDLMEIEEEKFEDEKLMVLGNIRVCNLCYTYNNKFNILNNIDFHIKDKERVLILGPSGCGKSTILKLIYKYLECPRDNIFINNYDINDYSLSDIRKNITYISQNEILYTDTIQNNIILGRNIDKSKFLDINHLVYIDEIIKDNILGYDYPLEENGVNISGGQRQRIILARSLLKDSKIVMIDEGLNQIDIDLERKILKNIFYYFYDRTFIIVSHRNENMDLYDKVIRIDKNGAYELERGGKFDR